MAWGQINWCEQEKVKEFPWAKWARKFKMTFMMIVSVTRHLPNHVSYIRYSDPPSPICRRTSHSPPTHGPLSTECDSTLWVTQQHIWKVKWRLQREAYQRIPVLPPLFSENDNDNDNFPLQWTRGLRQPFNTPGSYSSPPYCLGWWVNLMS